ncbi:MAG: YfhO family protein [Clostridiales bacterium]|nr:YfhO family protein [Clostridiales bacterium]
MIAHSSGRIRSSALLFGVGCFVFWSILFILTNIYISKPCGFGAREVSTLRILRSRLMHADTSAYTFEEGMGMSFFRLLLSGYGGILSIPLSLLPLSIHPQAIALLDALRLSAAGAVLFYLIRTHIRKITLLPAIAVSFLYTGIVFLLCILLRFPIADTFFLLPSVIAKILHIQKEKQRNLSLSFLALTCACLCSSAAWAVLVLPALLVIFIVLKIRRSEVSTAILLQHLLSIGICAAILLPQFMQVPYALGKGEPSASFLRELGNDTDLYRSDVTFTCEATRMLLETSPSLFTVFGRNDVTSAESPEPVATEPRSSTSSSHFAFLNEWIYSLWPYLPIIPFQDTVCTGPVYSEPGTVAFTVSTVFRDPLYCAVNLPERDHPVEVLLNGRSIATISHNPGTVMIGLGTYNVGQTLTLQLRSSHPDDLAQAGVQFGYLNSINWGAYTDNATYGINAITLEPDGISADGTFTSDSTLLTNIPYEKGWTLYLNGEKTALRAYRDAWLCADVPSGSYLVHLHYSAPGSTLGGWVSGLSFLALAIGYALESKKTQSSSSSTEAVVTSSSEGLS